jgi:hypothetical protein
MLNKADISLRVYGGGEKISWITGDDDTLLAILHTTL